MSVIIQKKRKYTARNSRTTPDQRTKLAHHDVVEQAEQLEPPGIVRLVAIGGPELAGVGFSGLPDGFVHSWPSTTNNALCTLGIRQRVRVGKLGTRAL